MAAIRVAHADVAYFRSQIAARMTNRTPCATPMLTHFIRVSDRLAAFSSVVCGDEHAAAMISYMTPAETRNATPLEPPPRPSTAMPQPFRVYWTDAWGGATGPPEAHT